MLEANSFDSKLIDKEMKHFHRTQRDVSPKTGKKARKLKKNHSVEACKCFAPFVKLHWWDCPEVNKPCPIHGNVLYQNVRPEKAEPDQSVTVAFHPSLRTEKLFQPVKSLLAQCDPETKINFQYFSPRSLTDKENLKHETVQTSFEHLAKDASNNYFVEKTKSSVNDKTNRMKKLKECFHSSYNAIVPKYPPSIPIGPDFSDIAQEESAQPWQNFFNGDTHCGQNSEWFSPNPFGFEKLERLTGDKRDSDFITITQHDKDNVINHKIFEIDHGDRMNNKPMTGFPKHSTQFAYSSFNVNYPGETRRNTTFETRKEREEPKERKDAKAPRDSKEHKTLHKDRVKSIMSQVSDSSAGSVYVTPFLFMPPGVELLSDTEFEEDEPDRKNVAVQVEDTHEEKSKRLARYPQRSEMSCVYSEQKTNTVSLQTDPDPTVYNKKYTGYVTNYDSSQDTMSEKYSYCEKVVQTNVRDNTRIDTSTMVEDSNIKTTEVQTSNRYQIKEVLITRYNKPTREAANQVRSSTFDLQGGDSSATNKRLMNKPSFSNKATQFPRGSDGYDPLECEESKERMCRDYSDSESDRRKEEKPKHGSIMKAASSRSRERFKPPSEEKPSAVSDLSELKRMIYEYFERATCHCREREVEMKRRSRINVTTMTDGSRSLEKKDWMVNMQIQTTEQPTKDIAVDAVPTQVLGGSRQLRQSVLLDDPDQNRTSYICSVCGRSINKFSLNASTNTEEPYAVKEKTTIIETDYTEITKVKKTADPKDPTRKSITTSTKQTVKPITHYKTDSQKVMKTVQAQTSQTRSNIPVPVSVIPTQTRKPTSSQEGQECSRRISPNNSRGKPSSGKPRPQTQTFRECHCDDMTEMYLSLQENKYSPRSGNSYRTFRTESPIRNREEPKEKRESQKQQKQHFYHVSLDPSWPRDLVCSWKSHRSGEESPNRQKASLEKDVPLIDTFSIKNFTEPEEIGEPEKQNYQGVDKCKTRKGNNCGFVRMPSSSASQISISKGTLIQSKVIKSEDSVKTITQQLGCEPIKMFGDDPNDLFTVKSCHLNPITISYDGQSCDKLLTCSVCRSLMLLKGYKNDDVTYVPGPNDEFQNQNPQSESDEKLQTDEVPERRSYDKFTLIRQNVDEQEEDYVEKSSNYSDMTTRTIENDYFKEENSDSDCRV